MKKLLSLSFVALMATSMAFAQQKKVAVVTFFVDKYIDYSKLDVDAKKIGNDMTLHDDPRFDLRPLLKDFHKTFMTEYIKQFPFDMVEEKAVFENEGYQNYQGLDGIEKEGDTENANARWEHLVAIDGYKALPTGGNLLRSWRTEAKMLEIFNDVDGVMFVYMSYAFEPKVAIGGLGNAGIRAYMHMDLYNKEAKKVFKLNEYATSKKSVALVGGVPIMKLEKILPMCENGTEKLLADMNKKLPKLIKKIDKKL